MIDGGGKDAKGEVDFGNRFWNEINDSVFGL